MIRLSTTNEKIQAVLGGAVTTNQLHCVVCYSDDNGTTYVGGSQYTSTNDTTAVDICAAPGASTVRDIDFLSIRNRDTAAATVTVMVDVSATDSELVKATLAVGDQLVYTHSNGWATLDSAGQVKSSGSGGGDVATDAIWDAKGDLAVGTGANTASRLAVGTNGQVLTADSAEATGTKWATPSSGSGGDRQDFRLTLTTGLPVTTSDVTAAGTVYCAPYKGNKISLYDGAAWNVRTSAEFSLALSGLTSGKPYDVFCYDNATVPTLEFLVWTNDTTRATALAYQDGVLVKSGAATRRYLGTFYTTGTTTTEDSAAKRYLWNYYHRAKRSLLKTDATASWTYTTATFRAANNDSANVISFVTGVNEDSVTARVMEVVSRTAAGDSMVSSIGLDSVSAEATGVNRTIMSSTGNGYYVPLAAQIAVTPTAGKHYLSWLEYANAGSTCTWYGGTTFGISGEFFS